MGLHLKLGMEVAMALNKSQGGVIVSKRAVDWEDLKMTCPPKTVVLKMLHLRVKMTKGGRG